MNTKPLIQEGDLVAIVDTDNEVLTYMVQKTEDMVYDYTFTTAVGAAALGSFEMVENLEPKDADDPARIMYQVRAGVDVGMVYTEIQAGSIRRTPYKQKRPTATSPYVGYFDEKVSPFHDPRFEFYMRYNEKPAFAVYNPWGFSITPKMSFRGKKLMMYRLDPKCYADSASALKMSSERLKALHEAVMECRIPHRRITAYGIGE